MALTFDLTTVPESVWKNAEGNRSAVSEALIFLTMSVGIGEITEKTAPEFYARVVAVERVYGAMVSTHDSDTGVSADRNITITDVLNHVGLKTNARFDVEPRAAWLKRVVGNDLDDHARDVKRAQAAAKAVAAPVLVAP